MNVSLIILGTAVVVLALIALKSGGPRLFFSGLAEGGSIMVGVAPQLLVGFALAGLVTVLVPSQLVGTLVGEESGLRGIAIATVAGVLTPGGPFLQFPLVVALEKSGAAYGPLAAYLTAWALLSAQRFLVWELPLLPAPFALARWGFSLLLPIAAGLLVPLMIRAGSR